MTKRLSPEEEKKFHKHMTRILAPPARKLPRHQAPASLSAEAAASEHGQPSRTIKNPIEFMTRFQTLAEIHGVDEMHQILHNSYELENAWAELNAWQEQQTYPLSRKQIDRYILKQFMQPMLTKEAFKSKLEAATKQFSFREILPTRGRNPDDMWTLFDQWQKETLWARWKGYADAYIKALLRADTAVVDGNVVNARKIKETLQRLDKIDGLTESKVDPAMLTELNYERAMDPCGKREDVQDLQKTHLIRIIAHTTNKHETEDGEETVYPLVGESDPTGMYITRDSTSGNRYSLRLRCEIDGATILPNSVDSFDFVLVQLQKSGTASKPTILSNFFYGMTCGKSSSSHLYGPWVMSALRGRVTKETKGGRTLPGYAMELIMKAAKEIKFPEYIDAWSSLIRRKDGTIQRLNSASLQDAARRMHAVVLKDNGGGTLLERVQVPSHWTERYITMVVRVLNSAEQTVGPAAATEFNMHRDCILLLSKKNTGLLEEMRTCVTPVLLRASYYFNVPIFFMRRSPSRQDQCVEALCLMIAAHALNVNWILAAAFEEALLGLYDAYHSYFSNADEAEKDEDKKQYFVQCITDLNASSSSAELIADFLNSVLKPRERAFPNFAGTFANLCQFRLRHKSAK